MGNDNKVKNPIVETKNIFLREDIAHLGGATEVYNLEEEFAKTKRNKSPKLFFLVFLFILLLGIVSFVIVLQVDKRTQKVEVGISEFQDINLVELLSSAQDSETKLRSLQIELEDLQSAMDREIAKAKEETARQIELVQNRSLSDAERQRQIAQITANGNARVQSITADYQAQIAQKQDEIATAREEAEQSQLQAMDAAQRQQRIADNYQHLYELKMEEQAKMYEDKMRALERQHRVDLDNMEKYYKQLTDVLVQKFNPVFKIDQLLKERSGIVDLAAINSVLAGARVSYGTNAINLNPFMPELASEGILQEQDYRLLQNKVLFYNTIFNRMNAIPFTNGNVPALYNMNALYRSVILDYNQIWFDLANRIRTKNQLISQYLYALNSYSKLNRDSGYVLDPRDRNNIVVFVQDIYHISPDGTPAIIFRGDNEFIANVKVFPTATGYKATITEMPATNKIQPLDKILLLLQEDQ